jgi:hypothetical protein
MARLPVRLGLACHCSVHFLGAFAPGREILYLFGYLLLNFLRLLRLARREAVLPDLNQPLCLLHPEIDRAEAR